MNLPLSYEVKPGLFFCALPPNILLVYDKTLVNAYQKNKGELTKPILVLRLYFQTDPSLKGYLYFIT